MEKLELIMYIKKIIHNFDEVLVVWLHSIELEQVKDSSGLGFWVSKFENFLSSGFLSLKKLEKNSSGFRVYRFDRKI